jgi:hypothetical protein
MAANYSPSFAKNIIRRSLKAIIDPHPTKAQLGLLLAHFGDSCAYCGKRIHVYPKDAQLDHVISDGPNNISNRLYACEDCNEKEKRDADWQVFLRAKAKSDEEFSTRAQLIQQWLDLHANIYVELDEGTRTKLDSEIAMALKAFDESLATIRSMRPQKNA